MSAAMNSKSSTFRSHGARKNLLEVTRSINISSLRDEEAFSRPASFCPLKFAVQLNRLAVWHNESELYDMLVRVNHREHHAFHQSALRAAGDIEEVKLYAVSIGRHFPLQARTISAVTIMDCDQTILLDVEHRDLMVR